MVWLPSYVNKEIWLAKSFLLRHTIACNCCVKCYRSRTRFYSCHIARSNCKGGHTVQFSDCSQCCIVCPVLNAKANRIIVPVVWLTRAHHTHALIWIVEQKYWRAAFLIKGSSCLFEWFLEPMYYIYLQQFNKLEVKFPSFRIFQGQKILTAVQQLKQKLLDLFKQVRPTVVKQLWFARANFRLPKQRSWQEPPFLFYSIVDSWSIFFCVDCSNS